MNRDQYISKSGEHVCNCEAYDFPHRLDSKKCRELYNSKAIDRLENACKELGADSLDSLGLRSLFAPDNSKPLRF